MSPFGTTLNFHLDAYRSAGKYRHMHTCTETHTHYKTMYSLNLVVGWSLSALIGRLCCLAYLPLDGGLMIFSDDIAAWLGLSAHLPNTYTNTGKKNNHLIQATDICI